MAFATALLIGATPGNAAAVLAFRDAGFSMIGTLSGSLDLTGTTPILDTSFGAMISPVFAQLSAGPGDNSPDPFLRYGVSGATIWGRGESAGGTASGDAVQLLGSAGLLFLPQGYTGGPLSGSITFADALIDDFDLLQSSFVYRLHGSGDTFTVTFDKREPPAPIPLPAAFPALLGSLALLAAAACRSRTRRSQT